MRSLFLFWFVRSVAVLLVISSAAKLISAGGSARVLGTADPILAVSFRNVFLIVGAVELVVALICFFKLNINLQIGSITWLTSSILIYRIALWGIGYHKPCVCLGTLTEALHIQPGTADMAMKGVLAYFLIGSCIAMYLIRRHKTGASTQGAIS